MSPFDVFNFFSVIFWFFFLYLLLYIINYLFIIPISYINLVVKKKYYNLKYYTFKSLGLYLKKIFKIYKFIKNIVNFKYYVQRFNIFLYN